MEVATTNNHSQSHHHHHHNHHLGNGSAAGGVNAVSRSPFQREVREWQRIDPDTGALLSGRLEADRWINGPLNSYGKISDSQNISQPNGTQHIQRKQMEVLRSANGAMQVIRTQTVQKSSSTSRWATSTSTSSTTTTTRSTGVPPKALWAPTSPQGVDICELSSDDDNHLNVVDESTQSDAGVVHECTTTASMASNNGQELVDDHVDFVVINGSMDDDDVDDDDDDNDKLGHNLLPDTAPSLKLSNLMKSSSSISSQSSNNSNLTIATGNTHRNAGKISLHAIVGQAATTTATTATSSSSSSLSTNTLSSSTLSTWPKQPDIYGSNNKSSKRRVGVPTEAQAVTAGNAGNAGDAADVVATPTLRRDLESFRHYNDDDADADDLRLSARHQRRQQVSQSVYAPPLPLSSSCSLQRSRSISTDDLSNEWQQQHKPGEDDDEDQPCGDWRRVSKLRRSFQSQDYHNRYTPRSRPLDLPSSSTVSVARIRAELENGRRLNTAMRNNHVDLAALDNILNTTPQQQSSSSKPQLVKKSTFLTAESLQEIRGKLKKLSDESLYKEDFLAHQTVLKPAPVEVLEAPSTTTTLSVTPSAFRAVHNTHSLETRQRPKDTNSSEWHLRRKSYGFEKMSPPENRSIFRVDASTDSGLGRSGEQLGNWSPTERSAATASGQNATIIHFGRHKEQKQQHPVGKFVNTDETEHLSKRHSIAVEETWRDLRKTSQVRVNGDAINGNSSSNNNNSSQMQRSSAQKRVEFCKTEVHFAAESGRVNIVETDGKPPPTQNFRRRRRTASGPLQSLVKSASVSSSTTTSSSSTISSGDGANKSIASSTVTYRATLMEPPKLVTQPVTGTQVTVVTSAPKLTVEPRYSLLETTSSTSRHSYTSTSGVDTTDNENDELANIRGILKNKPVKPKPYHLGENIESAEVLWSVPATTKSESRENSPPSRESATEDGHSPVTIKSVAERVRIVEQRQFDKQQMQSSPAGNGYSTKINVSLGAEEWPETGAINTVRRRSSAQELVLQDLRAHQRVLDEGLKSTSLIMKTMRSASEFDEAMRRLSIASIESAIIQPTIVVPTPMLRSHSYQEESSSRRTSTTSITSSDLFGSALYDSLPRMPLAPPRLKLLGNTQIPVSQQLTQLRRLYDAAEQEEDSADEEVKRYFRENSHNNNSDSGGGTQCSSSPEDVVLLKGSEYSSSWSRLKAKRTIWKIEAQEQTLQRSDLPKSNVMNIALHAPRVQKPQATPPTLRIGQLVPVAKPRTLLVQPQLQAPHTDTTDESGSESLKIVKEARGARKLREHELSYFGVQSSPTPSTTQPHKLLGTPSSNPRRTLPTRSKHIHNEDAINATATTKATTATAAAAATTTTTTKWQLLNDRPDLLRHSPQGNDECNDDFLDDEEHCYENIANELTTTFRVKSPSPSPGSYERKTDLQRDAQILSEMTRNADQTMKALSDEAAFKDQRRRSCSLQRRIAKPLATIDERVKAQAVDAKSVSVTRGTFSSEARRNSRQSTPSPTRARSSSQSSIECCPRDRSRSSSRESMTQGGGSSDEQLSKQRVERLRMRTPKREKSRQDPITEQRSSRQSSKPRNSNTNSNEVSESKRTHHHSRHSRESREKEHSHTSEQHSSKHSSSLGSSRLLRSSRVGEESRPRTSSQRTSEREKERVREGERARERSRGSEKHKEELTRSRGHSSRSRHSEPSTVAHKSSRSSRSNQVTNTSTHRKSVKPTTTAAATPTTTAGSTTKANTTASHKTSTATSSAPTATTHNELTHGKSTLNGHAHHHHNHHSSKHSQGQRPQHHVHSLTTTTIAATKQQRDRHGKDRK